MNTLCLNCGSHYIGQRLPCKFCGSTVPAFAFSDDSGSSDFDGKSNAETLPTAIAEVPANVQRDLPPRGAVGKSVVIDSDVLSAIVSPSHRDAVVDSQEQPNFGASQKAPKKIDRTSRLAIGGLLAVLIAGIGGNYFFSSKNSQPVLTGYSNSTVAAPPSAPVTGNSSGVAEVARTKTETIVIQEFECGDQCGLIVKRGKRSDEYYLCALKDLRPDSKIPICREIFGTGGDYPKMVDRTVTLDLKQDPVQRDSFWITGGRLHPKEARQSIANSPTSDAVSAPTVRVGDTYTYETLDLIEPKLSNVTNREIVDVNPSGFVMSIVNAKSKFTRRLSYDSNLNLTSTRSGDNDGTNYSPALQYFKFPLRTGDSWNSSSTETNIKTGKTRTHVLRGTVGGLEQITVPAGTFRAFRITIQSELHDDGQISTGQDISWYSPDVRRTVKSELESRDLMGKIGRRNINLISYNLR